MLVQYSFAYQCKNNPEVTTISPFPSFTEQMQLQNYQVAFDAGKMVSPCLILRKEGPVSSNNGSQTRWQQFDPKLCYLLVV